VVDLAVPLHAGPSREDPRCDRRDVALERAMKDRHRERAAVDPG
jgi:hypothetical protein